MIIVSVVILLALLIPTGYAAAQGGGEFELPPGVTWDEVNAVASQMYCDVCEGIPLDECESIACRQWREDIALRLSEGYTEDEIIDYFVERYGGDVAALPRDKSDRFLALIVPVILILMVGVVGGYQVWQLRKRGMQAGQPVRRRSTARLTERPMPDDLDPDLLDRLARELEGLDA
jgi:cytochrome c-type biogenesis protein CcmH